jgi:hypothetical protein
MCPGPYANLSCGMARVPVHEIPPAGKMERGTLCLAFGRSSLQGTMESIKLAVDVG